MLLQTQIIVVGGDDLAFEVCRELLVTSGHHVTLLWHTTEFRAKQRLDAVVEQLRAAHPQAFAHCDRDPLEMEALTEAGLVPGISACVVAVSQDDRLNLRVALLARDINDDVRITLRQFNPMLGYKIQEGLERNCTAVSPAALAAATYASAAVDPSCFYAIPFPTLEPLLTRVAKGHDARSRAKSRRGAAAGIFGFAERAARDFGIEGLNVAQAEARLGLRIVSVAGDLPYACSGAKACAGEPLLGRRLAGDERIAAFGPVDRLRASRQASTSVTREHLSAQITARLKDLGTTLGRVEPIIRNLLIGSLIFYLTIAIYFAHSLHLNIIAALYFVASTMTTVGYGDITPCHDCGAHLGGWGALRLGIAVSAMLLGVLVTAVFTATITSGLNLAQVRRLRGLRQIHRDGHIIVCGAGNVGTLVIDFLRDLGERVVVVERNPDQLLIELARDREIDLLSGDATNDETISFCSPERAKALVGVTNVDTVNLEAALGARTRVRGMRESVLHAVLRIDDLAFGQSIKRHFGILSFSTTELTAPTIAGLARFESTRGRIALFGGADGERIFQLAERVQGPENAPPPSPPEHHAPIDWVPLFVWREGTQGRGTAYPIHNFAEEVRPGDRLLFMVPIDQFA